jgi:competence protein ComGC
VNHTVEYYPVDFAGNTGETNTLTVEKKAVEDDDQDGGGAGFLGWDFFIVLAIIALIILISVPKLFGMRRKAKESDARAAVKDIGTAYAQMMMEEPPKSSEQPPKPPQGK